MLRSLSLALLLAASAGAASAQTSERFAVGVTAGTTGFGVEGQFRAAPRFNLRVSGDVFSYDTDFATDDVDYEAEIDFNQVGGFVDVHPFDNSFFVSGGVYTGDRSVEVNATSNMSAEIGNVVFTPQQIGTLTGTVDFGGTAPFLGVGYNNTFRTNGRIGFKAVVGAAFGEDPSVDLRRTGGEPLPAFIQTQFDRELRNEEAELQQDAEDLKTLPVVQVGLTYRF
ncbi:MAG: hypothetical protein KY446_05975 [Proteobacteria bacterium]|nr:hypothetical protein [Pseudomonadota bacterium]MBW3617289.1 hypothetical protein [Pseudomonadota bacterium]